MRNLDKKSHNRKSQCINMFGNKLLLIINDDEQYFEYYQS